MQNDLEQLLQTLRSVNKQLDIDGMGNVWIMKPAGKSRGRGILCLNSLKGIQVQKPSRLLMHNRLQHPSQLPHDCDSCVAAAKS